MFSWPGIFFFFCIEKKWKKKMRGVHIKPWTIINNDGPKAVFTVQIYELVNN